MNLIAMDRRRPANKKATDPRPLYTRITEQLRWQILSGQIKERIDGEIEIASRLKVSRGTVKQAVTALVDEGLLYRERGRGTFVNQSRVDKYYLEISSFTGTMRAMGLSPVGKIISFECQGASPEVAAKLNLDPGEEVFVYKRSVLIDGVPVAMTISHIPAKKFPGLEITEAGSSLYAILRGRYGSTPTRAHDEYEATLADAQFARALSVKRGTPMLQVNRVTHDQTDEPIEYSQSRFIFGKVTVDISPLHRFLDQQFHSDQMTRSLWHHVVSLAYSVSKPG